MCDATIVNQTQNPIRLGINTYSPIDIYPGQSTQYPVPFGSSTTVTVANLNQTLNMGSYTQYAPYNVSVSVNGQVVSTGTSFQLNGCGTYIIQDPYSPYPPQPYPPVPPQPQCAGTLINYTSSNLVLSRASGKTAYLPRGGSIEINPTGTIFVNNSYNNGRYPVRVTIGPNGRVVYQAQSALQLRQCTNYYMYDPAIAPPGPEPFFAQQDEYGAKRLGAKKQIHF